MLYELVGICRVPYLNPTQDVKSVVKVIGRLIINNRGVVRGIYSLNREYLPKIMVKHQQSHFEGYHFLIQFDSSPKVQNEILRTIQNDPRIIRAGIFNLAKKDFLSLSSVEKNRLPSLEGARAK